VAEMRSVELLTNTGGTKREEFGGLRPNEFLSLSHVPRRLAGHADVDVHPVLGGLALGHPKKADGWTDTVRVDDGSTVGVVVARLTTCPSAAAQNAATRGGLAASQPSVIELPELQRTEAAIVERRHTDIPDNYRHAIRAPRVLVGRGIGRDVRLRRRTAISEAFAESLTGDVPFLERSGLRHDLLFRLCTLGCGHRRSVCQPIGRHQRGPETA